MKQINVFILEDDPNRARAFHQRFNSPDIPDGITCVLSITDDLGEAKRLLTSVNYDLVMLDHDLANVVAGAGLIAQVQLREETGYDLAHWLEENPEIANRHGNYLSHSLNQVGRDRIIAALKNIEIRCTNAPWLWEESIFWKHVSIK